MVRKEECEVALDDLKIQHDYLASNMHYNYPFSIWKLQTIQKCFENLIKEHFEPQPYKFEDLKIGMWVYDIKREYEDYSFIKITKILSKEDCEHLYHDKNKKVFFDNMVCHAREFEEGRFFPVWYANVE